MSTDQKVLELPNICGIEIDLTGSPAPSVDTSLQPFYNSYVQNSTAKVAYFSPSRGKLSESAKETRAGMVYEQKLSLQFPSNDPTRAMRIAAYLKVKYIYVKLSNGMVLFFGRNDYNQNTPPKRQMKSDEKMTQMVYTCVSMFPMGFTNGSFDFQLSEQLPINFYNL